MGIAQIAIWPPPPRSNRPFVALFLGPNLTDLSNSVIHRLTRVINSQSLEDAQGRKCLGRINQPHDKLSHRIVALLATINHVHLQIGHHIGHHVHFHVGHHNVILTLCDAQGRWQVWGELTDPMTNFLIKL